MNDNGDGSDDAVVIHGGVTIVILIQIYLHVSY